MVGYASTFRVELFEPDITITSEMIRWAIIHEIERQNPGAQLTHSATPKDDEYAVDVHYVARSQRNEQGKGVMMSREED